MSDTLAQTTSALCEDLTEERLDIARDAWRDARLPWKRVEVVTFGPTFDYPHRLKFRIDDWPVNNDAVEELVAGDQRLTPDDFTRLGSAHRGLPVVEYLLWSEAGEMSTLLALSADPRRCMALASASADVHANAVKLMTLWGDEWIDLVSDEGEERQFESAQELIVEWVNRLTFTVENIREKKFEKPLGDLTPEDVRPDVIESRLSGRSLQDARDVLRGVVEVWRGIDTEDEIKGVSSLVVDRRVINHVDKLFDDATAALDRLEGPMALITTNQREEVELAIASLRALQVGLQTDLAEATESTIRFNDTTDGD